MRIVYCTSPLTTGGIQSVTVTKANALAGNPDNKVWIITCGDDSGKSAFPVSENVALLGIKGKNDWRFPWNLLRMIPDWMYLRKNLRLTLDRIRPDIVVSTSGMEKWVIPCIKGPWATVREIHNVKYYRRREAVSFPGKVLAAICDFLDFDINVRRFDRIVILTQEDRDLHWSKSKNVSVIPNPLRFSDCRVSSLDNKEVIAVGRLVYQKNFGSLVRAFSTVRSRFPDWRLSILGEGEERASLERLIKDLSLEGSVFLEGNCDNVKERMLSSSLLALTSRFEGMGVVLIEAMGCGLPVVSYACQCGPKDVITDGVDGFLVPEGDERTLADRICCLIGNEEERKRMGLAARESSSRYALPVVIRQWMDLFMEIRS